MLFSYNFNKKIKLGGLSPRFKIRASRAAFSLLIALIAAIGTHLIVRAAPTILATMTAAFVGVHDGDGKADPGETIEYTAVIQNSGADPATGITFNDVIDLNTTLVAGSLNVSPLAVDDSYSTIGNTLLDVGIGLPDPAVHVTTGSIDSLFDNDTEFLGDSFTLLSVEADTTAPFTTATEQGGSVTVDADGNFSYIPPVDFIGTDYFDYVITDDGAVGSGALTGAGRVTINVTQMIWYVKNDATAGGLGRSTDPFDSLAEAQTASVANETIYVFQGDGTTTGQNAGIALKSGQRLIGEGVALTVPVSVNGGANPTTLRAAGSQPQIDNTSGNGVSVTNISNVEIRGLNIAGSDSAVDVTTSGANSGSFELANNTIRSAGTDGIDVNGGGSGTLTVNIHDNTVTSTGNGIDILRTAGNVNITTFDDNVVHGNTGGAGIVIVGPNVTFDATPGSIFQTVLGGTTTLGQSGNAVGTSGMVLTNVSGDLSFTDLDIFANTGNGLSASGTTAYTGSAGFQIAVTPASPDNFGTSTINVTSGPALTISQATVDLRLSNLTSTTTTSGLSLTTVAGQVRAPSGSSVTKSSGAGTAFNIASSSATVNYAGTLNVTSGGGVSLTSNTGATITFSGGMTLSTGSNAAFSATGGGTVNVCDDNPCNPGATGSVVNTLTSTTGTALNVANTTIGANKLEFRSISSNGASSGIVLNNTGSGGLTVTGNTSGNCGGNVTNSGATVTAPISGDCSGGTILSSTSTGILLTSASNISLTRMRIASSADDGIGGTSVSGFTLTSSLVENNGNAVGDRGIDITNLSGSGGIATSTIRSSKEHNIVIANTSGNLTAFNVTNSQIATNDLTPDTGTGDDGIQILNNGTGSMAISVTQSAFTDNKGDHFQAASSASATGSITAVFSNNTLKTTAANDPQVVGGGITINPGNAADITFTISNNNIQQAFDDAININHDPSSTAAGNLEGTISNNIIGTSGDPDSGSESSNAITVAAKGAGTNTIAVTGNTIYQFSNLYGIFIGISEGSASLNATVTGNTVKEPGSFAINGIRVDAGATSGPPADNGTLCITLTGNDATGSAKSPPTDTDIRLRQRFSTTIKLPGYGGANNDTTAVNNFVAANNDPAGITSAPTVSSAQNVGGGGGGFIGGAACTTPIAMAPATDLALAQNHLETNLIANAQVASTDLNSANTFTFAFTSLKLPEQASEIDPSNTVANASTTIGGGKPLFRGARLAPALSGETVTVPAFTLPAGKSVTIKFQVTVDNPIDNPVGATQISNQGTVGYDVAQTKLTDDPSIGGISDPTITLIDRPDTTVSSINRHTPSTTSTNATSVIWRVTFANPVAGLTSSNFTLANTGLTSPSITTVSAVTASPDTQWDVTVNTGTGDGTLGLNMTSDAGLSHDVTNLTFTGQLYTLDLTPPTVSMSSPAPSPTNTSLITVTAQFSEPVNNFIATDIVAGNATVGNFIAVDGDTYTFDLTPSGQGLVMADIAAGVATDTAGNNNTAATQFSRTFDSVSPTVTMTSAASDPTNANPIPATAQFSENMTGFDAGDITPGNATVANFVAVDGDTYTFDLTPLSDGLVTADIAAGVATDAAGNGNTAATQFSRTFDSAGPTVTMSSAAPDPTNTSPIPVTTQFSENVTGFDVGDITPGNATVDNFIAVDGDTYTFDLTPGGQGLVTADIAAGVAQDSGGNGNSAATQFSRTFDSAGPTVTMSSAAPDPTNTSPIPVSVQFNENVTGFDMSDITPGNATVGNFIAVDGDTYTFDLTPLADGPVTADIGAGLATDTAGNGNTAAAQFIRTFDSDAPTVAMTSAALNPTNTSPIPVTVQFSENVTGFDVGDITPGNATVGNFIAVDGDTYTFDLTPLADGPVTADIAAGVAQDSGGNLNNAAIQFIRTFDTVAPTMTLNQAVGQADPTSSSPINFTVIFNEPVSGFGDSAADVSLSGTAGATTALVTESAPNDGTTYNVAVSGMSVDGTVIASIPTGSALDAAGNGNTAVSTSTDDTVTFIADAIPPSVTSVNRADPSPSSAASVNFTVTFSESVTGVNTIAPFDDFDLTTTGVSGAIVSGVSGSGAVYTVTVDTGTGNGTIRLDVLDDDMIIDAASNPLAGGFTSGEVYTIDKSANVEVTIGGSNVGNFSVAPDNSIRQSFAGLNNGPVKVVSANSLDIIAALRVIWQEPGERTSYSEMMGLPKEQLSDEYWFPWYNNLDTAAMTQGLRIANVDATDTTIKVMLGATELDSFTLQGGESVRVSYAVNNGPIQIFSVEGNNIIAALRVIWQEPGERTSYSEMMGLPKEQLSTEYWFPWYNNLDTTSMTQGLRIASVNASGTNTVEVWVGNTMQDSFSLAAGASVRVGYPVNDGPVRIVCTTCSGNEKIISSLRVIWQETGERTSYSEMMGLPLEQLSTEYWFPWYNNFDMNHGLRIANVNATGDNTIQVWVGDTLQDSFDLVVGESVRVSYSVNAGPIRIVCTTCLGNEKILTSLQVIWHETGQSTSYSEMMGLPLEQLSTEYWFPWYNNATSSMAQGFRIGVP